MTYLGEIKQINNADDMVIFGGFSLSVGPCSVWCQKGFPLEDR